MDGWKIELIKSKRGNYHYYLRSHIPAADGKVSRGTYATAEAALAAGTAEAERIEGAVRFWKKWFSNKGETK
jgi:hypothetical protein